MENRTELTEDLVGLAKNKELDNRTELTEDLAGQTKDKEELTQVRMGTQLDDVWRNSGDDALQSTSRDGGYNGSEHPCPVCTVLDIGVGRILM